MKEQEIIEKIRKLLALGNSSNENEAQSAILMAQKLMAQYKIELKQIEDAPIDHDVLEMDGDKKEHRTKWKRLIAALVAKNFQCDLFFYGSGSYKAVFVGKKDQLDICKEVYLAAIRFIDHNFSLYWNQEGKFDQYGRLKPLSESISMKDSYARGFHRRLLEKFEEQKVRSEKEGWGLVLVEDKDVVSYMNEKKFTGHLSNAASKRDSAAVLQGYKDGGNFGETGQKKIGGSYEK